MHDLFFITNISLVSEVSRHSGHRECKKSYYILRCHFDGATVMVVPLRIS